MFSIAPKNVRNEVVKLIFCLEKKYKIFVQIDSTTLGVRSFPIALSLDEFFLHADKYQRFLQVDFNKLTVKAFQMVILSLQIGMIKHSKITQSSNFFSIFLQYLEKEVMDGVHFLHADKHQSFYKLGLLFLMEVTKHVQSTQNRKLAIFLH